MEHVKGVLVNQEARILNTIKFWTSRLNEIFLQRMLYFPVKPQEFVVYRDPVETQIGGSDGDSYSYPFS